MDFDEYRKRGKEMVDYIADYLENIRDRKVFPNVKPGYMRNLLPDSAPIEGENWDKIFNDVERVIMPGVTHWQSPHMHAYFPALNSFPSLLGDMLADAINCLGFTWASSPACTELETIVMNWLGKMIGLPDEFLHVNTSSKGGGVIQTTASEATLVCLLAGRTQAIKYFHEKSPGLQDAEINARLVAYCSDQAHSSVEKAALIGLVRMRYIESDENLAMRGNLLREAIEDDVKQGLIPFWVCATLGTTGACAFDNLVEVGDVCREYKLWLHVDAAYAGSAFICPEFRIWLKGIDKADSIAFNPSKWLMVHFDCTAMWVKDSTAVHRTFNVEPLYLQHENSGLAIDYMHWQIPLSKRFRSLKLWFVLRSYGIKGLQKHIREGVRMAQKFEALVLADHRFEIPAERHLGMVVFRIKGDNDLTERLLKRLNHRGNLHCVPASLKGKYVIRFTVTSTRTTSDDIVSDWAEIRQVTTEILEELDIKLTDRAKVSLKDTREKNEAFGSSLLLANSPMSPKIVNGSFAAIFDADEFLTKAYAGFRIAHQDSPSMRRRVRGILMSGKQFSLDSRMDLFAQSCLDSGSSYKNNSSGTAIREDNEDSWEAYECLGTPPITPPPMVSPLILTPSDVERMNLGLLAAETMESEIPVVVRVQNRNPSNSLTVDYQRYTIDKTVFVHNFDKLVSSTRCCDAQTVHQCCNSNSNPTIVLSPLQRHNKNHSVQLISQKQDSPATSNNVYHGKRYLDPVIPEKCCILLNSNSFKVAAESARLAFQSSVYSSRMMSEIEEVCSDDSNNSMSGSDPNESQKRRHSNSDDQNQIIFPKIRVRICDEYGQRIKTSFDSSSIEENISNNSLDLERLSPGELWSSLEYDISPDAMMLASDGWTIIHPIQQTTFRSIKTKCCQKCGHHTSNSSSTTSNNSNTEQNEIISTPYYNTNDDNNDSTTISSDDSSASES